MGQTRVRLPVLRGRSHSLYDELLEAPPEGVTYVPDGPSGAQAEARARSRFAGLRRNGVVRALADPLFVHALPSQGESPGGVAFSVARRLTKSKMRDRADFDLLHSPGSAMLENIPWIVENDIQWVVDFEHAAQLIGLYGNWRKRIYRSGERRRLEKQLGSRYCRKLMPWTDAAKKTVESLLPFPEVLEKVEVLPLAIRPAPPRPRDIQSHDKVRILFMGSANYRGEFWSKGGYEALESYRLLRERVGDKVELMFRCWMPDELRDGYASMPGLHMITDVLPREELDRLLWESDIFLFPAHSTPGMAILEAMRFGLPVVAKRIWATPELVEDGVTGFLVEPSEKAPYYLPGFVPNWSMDSGPFLPHMKARDERVIEDLANRLQRLAESEGLRRAMGEAGKREIDEGKASIGLRNRQLRKIYSEAVGG